MTDERVERLWMAKRRDDIRRELAGLRAEVREECAREVEAIGRNEWRNDVVPAAVLADRLRAGAPAPEPTGGSGIDGGTTA